MSRCWIVAFVLAACGEPANNLVVFELPLARNSALAEIKSLHIELFAETTSCGNLVRIGADDGLQPIAAMVLDLTADERRNGSDRYVDNLPAGTWNVRIQAFSEDELRVGYACSPRALEAGQTIVIEYVAREQRRPAGQ
jgi:hypothetical protein